MTQSSWRRHRGHGVNNSNEQAMTIIIYFFISGAIFFVLGCFFTKKKIQKKFYALIKKNEQEYKDREEKVLNEQAVISDQFFQANKLKANEKIDKLNDAFLQNGRTVEIIGRELKSAQNLVTNAFSSLPNIYTCSQSSHSAAQKSKEKIEELTYSVDSWQGTMQSLQNIQGLIDGIHDKAAQIRDVSSEANLLALNASIEAARAGEHGRGFAVVATSMRELSNKSAEATFDINTAVENTRAEVDEIIGQISENVSLLTEVSLGVSDNFGNIENEENNITTIAQTALSEAECSNQQFRDINTEVNTQLENIIGLLADTLGEVSGNKIQNISVSSDLSRMHIIDVRSQEEFNDELGHIESAQLICLQDEFEQQLKRLDKNENYLFVCRSGGRSSRAARIALGLGFKNISNMQGGMLEYCKIIGKPANALASTLTNNSVESSSFQDTDNDDITLF